MNFVKFILLSFIYIKIKFCANLLFKDIEDLVYEIKTDDVNEDFYEDKNLLHFSDYPQDSNFFDPVNKKDIGKMKEEFKGEVVSELVGLKSKMYSLVSVDGTENIKSKRGHQKCC